MALFYKYINNFNIDLHGRQLESLGCTHIHSVCLVDAYEEVAPQRHTTVRWMSVLVVFLGIPSGGYFFRDCKDGFLLLLSFLILSPINHFHVSFFQKEICYF